MVPRMATSPSPVCITCGLSAGPVQLNRLQNGQTCPTCRDRVLDSLPAILPSHSRLPAGAAHLEEQGSLGKEAEFDGENRPWPPHGLGN